MKIWEKIKKFCEENRLICAVIAVVFVMLVTNVVYVDLLGDDAVYSTRAVGLVDYMFGDAQPSPLKLSEEYPWWANLSYHDHPPLVIVVFHFFLLFSQGVFATKLPSILFALGSVLILYIWMKEKTDKKRALVASLLLLGNNIFIWSARVAYLESGVLFFVLLVFYFFERFLRDRKYWPYFGVALGLALLTKYTALFIVPTILCCIILTRRDLFRDRRLYLSMLVAFVIFLPVIVYNVGMYSEYGHFDLQWSGVFHQDTPWNLDRSVGVDVFGGVKNIFLALGRNITYFYASIFVIAIVWAVCKRRNTLALLSMLWLTFMLVVIGPVARFLSLYAFVIAVLVADLFFSIKKEKMRNVLFGLVVFYLFGFSFYNQIMFDSFLPEVKGVTVSELKSENMGVYQLDKYLGELIDRSHIWNKQDFMDELKSKQPHLRKYSLVNRKIGNPEGEDMYEIFVYDNNINWFSRVWLFERRIFYDNLIFIDDKMFVDLNKDDEYVKDFYFIKATEHGPLDQVEYRTRASEIIEQMFIDRGLEPVEVIRRLDGEEAFRVYKYNAGK